MSFYIAILCAFLLPCSYTQTFRKPLGKYTPRDWHTSTVNLELDFLDDGTVKYWIYYPQSNIWTSDSYPVIMLGPAVFAVRVPNFRMDHWLEHAPGSFEEWGLRVFFYDPVLDRIAVNAAGRTFQIAHVSDPVQMLKADVLTKPDGVYQSIERGLEVTMVFDSARSRASYNFVSQDKGYEFPFDVDFTMLSNSLIRVWVPQNQLYSLHGRFPGLSHDYFYTNIGYDPVNDEITFVLDKLRTVMLKKVQPTTITTSTATATSTPSMTAATITTGKTTSTAPTSTATVSSTKALRNCGEYCRPFGEFCIDSNTAKMSVRFDNHFTMTFSAHHQSMHLLAREARYEVYEETDNIIVSVDVVNSDLNAELRKINWFGSTRLNLTFNPYDNIVMVKERGLIARMHLQLGCAEAIETSTEEPKVSRSKPRNPWAAGEKEVHGDFHKVLLRIIKSLR